MVEQQPSHPVWEHLVTELAKMNQLWCRAVGLRGDAAILGGEGAANEGCTLYKLRDRLGVGSHLHSATVLNRTKLVYVLVRTLGCNLNQIRKKPSHGKSRNPSSSSRCVCVCTRTPVPL